MLKNKERYFKFSTDSAIYNLGMHKYSMKELKSLEKRINFDSSNKNLVKCSVEHLSAGVYHIYIPQLGYAKKLIVMKEE